jgi:hypothetical protein
MFDELYAKRAATNTTSTAATTTTTTTTTSLSRSRRWPSLCWHWHYSVQPVFCIATAQIESAPLLLRKKQFLLANAQAAHVQTQPVL